MKVRVIKTIKEVGFSGAPRSADKEPAKQDTRTHRVMPLKVGRPIKRKPVKLEEQEDEVTVVIPGGFKPPHKGHVEMINHFARLPNVSKVIVYMGSKPRQSADGSVVITKDKSIELFNLFDLASNVEFGEVRQRPKKSGGSYENPLNDAADLLFDPEYEGMGIAMGHSEKDPKRGKIFASIAKNAKTPLQANVVTVPPAPAVEDLSATDLRNAIENEDLEGMKKFMPEDLIEDYLNILTGE